MQSLESHTYEEDVTEGAVSVHLLPAPATLTFKQAGQQRVIHPHPQPRPSLLWRKKRNHGVEPAPQTGNRGVELQPTSNIVFGKTETYGFVCRRSFI